MPQPWSESLEASAINNHDMYIKDFVFTVIYPAINFQERWNLIRFFFPVEE